MTILEKAKNAADELARDIGGIWVVLGNPEHVPYFTEMRDVSITQEANIADFAIDGDVVLYRTN